MVFSAGRVQAHLLGSGWGEQVDGRDEIAAALDSGLPTVVDADGLSFLPERCPDNWLLTPHAGELAKLLGEERSWVTDDPVRAVQAGVEKTGATVLLKGEWAQQKYLDFPTTDIRSGGKFKGFMVEGVVAF